MPIPMMAPPAAGQQGAMQDAVQNANPRGLMMQPVGVSGPTADDTSEGIIDQLKTVVQAAQAIAGTNPQVADEMNAIMKLAVQAALKTQQQGANQPQAGSPGTSTMY